MSIQTLKAQIKCFLEDEEGLTTVEYAIAGSLVGLAVGTAFTQLGGRVGEAINALKNAIVVS